MEKIKVLVSGCNGHMGQIVCRLIGDSDDMYVSCGYDSSTIGMTQFPVFNSIEDLENSKIHPDIIIDFSQPECTMSILRYFAHKHSIPMVIATTGLSEFQLSAIKSHSEESLIFISSNMSYEINLLEQLLSELAPKLSNYDIEIVETHHNRKKDDPSGTAKTLANAINAALGNSKRIVYGRTGKREPDEIGIASLRGGNVVGTHTIKFLGEFDSLEITHTAFSRDMFAEGALKAARYMMECKKSGISNGLFGMKDLQ